MPGPSVVSVARRARAVPWLFWIIGGAFVALRLVVVVRVHQAFGDFPDSSTYQQAATGPQYSYLSFVGNAMRPFTVPLLYWVLPSDGARVAAQFVVSVAAWLTLASVAALSFRDRRVQVAAFASILLFGSTYLVTTWDLAIASESLTISLGVLSLAAWMRFVPTPTRSAAIAAVATTTLWMFTRSQAFPLVLALGLVLAVWAWWPEARTRKLLVAGALVAVALWGFVSVKNQEQSYAARNGQGVGIFSETFALNLRFRILTDPAAEQWFRDQGMPAPDGLQGHPRTELAVDDWEGWGSYFDAYRRDTALTRWVDEHGQAALTRYTLVHPVKVGRQFASDLPALLVPDRGSVTYIDSPVVLGPVDSLLTPYAGSGVPGLPTVWLVVACVVMAVLPRRRAVAVRVLAVALALVIVSLAGTFLGWLGAPVEFARHALPFTLLLPIGLVLVLLALVDARVRDRAGVDPVAARAPAAGDPPPTDPE